MLGRVLFVGISLFQFICPLSSFAEVEEESRRLYCEVSLKEESYLHTEFRLGLKRNGINYSFVDNGPDKERKFHFYPEFFISGFRVPEDISQAGKSSEAQFEKDHSCEILKKENGNPSKFCVIHDQPDLHSTCKLLAWEKMVEHSGLSPERIHHVHIQVNADLYFSDSIELEPSDLEKEKESIHFPALRECDPRKGFDEIFYLAKRWRFTDEKGNLLPGKANLFGFKKVKPMMNGVAYVKRSYKWRMIDSKGDFLPEAVSSALFEAQKHSGISSGCLSTP